MAVLKLVQGKFIITEAAHCLDDTHEVTIKLIGLDYEDYRTLMEAYKVGMEVQVRPIDVPIRGGHGDRPTGPKPRLTPR